MAADVKYRVSELDYDQAELEAVLEVVRSQWLSLGPRTAEFERRFAEYLEIDHAVAVSSATAALHLALLASGIGPGDEVLVPSYTFVASVNPIVYVGAQPVFVDICGLHDLNLDPRDAERKLTARTRAIVVVHMAGFPAAMDAIMRLAERHSLVVIEDACHAVGARCRPEPGGVCGGRRAGTLGDAGCFSFFANKNLATGEGGMLVTRDGDLAHRVRLARSHGMTKTSWDKALGRAVDYDVVQVGYNYRCTELTAALGLVQLSKLEAGNARRRQLVARYRERLADCEFLSLPFADRLEDSAHHIFPVMLNDPARRAALRQALADQGVQTTFHYPPVHQFTHYREAADPAPAEGDAGLERTCQAAAREVTLPLHPRLTVADVDAICDILLGVISNSK